MVVDETPPGHKKPPAPAEVASQPGKSAPLVIRTIRADAATEGTPPREGLLIQPQRVATIAPDAGIRQVRLDAPTRPERAPRLFETVRVIALGRFRQSMRRQRTSAEKKGLDFAATQPQRARLAALLDELYAGSATIWPDVVIVRRPASGVIETNYALIGSTIFFGAHLSPDWSEGQESERFFEALIEGLSDWQRAHRSQFEPVGVRTGPDPDSEG